MPHRAPRLEGMPYSIQGYIFQLSPYYKLFVFWIGNCFYHVSDAPGFAGDFSGFRFGLCRIPERTASSALQSVVYAPHDGGCRPG